MQRAKLLPQKAKWISHACFTQRGRALFSNRDDPASKLVIPTFTMKGSRLVQKCLFVETKTFQRFFPDVLWSARACNGMCMEAAGNPILFLLVMTRGKDCPRDDLGTLWSLLQVVAFDRAVPVSCFAEVKACRPHLARFRHQLPPTTARKSSSLQRHPVPQPLTHAGRCCKLRSSVLAACAESGPFLCACIPDTPISLN